MKTSFRSLTLAFALAAASVLGAAVTHAQTVITSLPYTITANGTYVLNSNLGSSQNSGYLIDIKASNVTIDFQGHYISGPVGNTGQFTYGIHANEQSNLTIRNGTIAFCQYGIDIEGNGSATTNSVGHQIDRMRITYCYQYGIYISASPASQVTNCQVSQGGYSGAASAFGIAAAGSGITVSNCAISTVTASNSLGIVAGTGSFVRQNTISNCVYGVFGGKYQDNLAANCTTPFSNGVDAGGNN